MLHSIYNSIFSYLNSLKYLIVEITMYNIKKSQLKKLLHKKNPLISIICPTYNRCDLLINRAVKSVLSQTYKNFEFLIISDGSTDDTELKVKNIQDNRIKFFSISRDRKRYPETIENHWFCGPVKAINHGLKKMKGDWICRIDDDDIWTENHIEVLLNHALKEKAEFVSSSQIEIRDGIKKTNNHINENPRIGGVQTWLYAGYLKFIKANINCWRKKWNKVNDTDIQERMVKIKVKMSFLNCPTVKLIPRPGDNNIGIKAYKQKEKSYLEKYKF